MRALTGAVLGPAHGRVRRQRVRSGGDHRCVAAHAFRAAATGLTGRVAAFGLGEQCLEEFPEEFQGSLEHGSDTLGHAGNSLVEMVDVAGQGPGRQESRRGVTVCSVVGSPRPAPEWSRPRPGPTGPGSHRLGDLVDRGDGRTVEEPNTRSASFSAKKDQVSCSSRSAGVAGRTRFNIQQFRAAHIVGILVDCGGVLRAPHAAHLDPRNPSEHAQGRSTNSSSAPSRTASSDTAHGRVSPSLHISNWSS